MTSETLAVSRRIFGALPDWLQPSTAVSPPIKHRQNPSALSASGLTPKTLTVEDKDVRRLEYLLDETYQKWETLAASGTELEIPEIFDLRPLFSQQIAVSVLKVEPGRFYFAADDDIELLDIEG